MAKKATIYLGDSRVGGVRKQRLSQSIWALAIKSIWIQIDQRERKNVILIRKSGVFNTAFVYFAPFVFGEISLLFRNFN